MLKITIERGVIRELLQACEYFDSQDEGLGQQFESAFRDGLARVAEMPLSRLLHFGHYRRVLVAPFKYHIYYQVIGDEIIVTALIHGHSDPAAIDRRLRRTDSAE